MDAFDYIDRHSNDLVDNLRTLVGIPTVNPPGQDYDVITRYLTAQLSEAGLAAKRYAIPRAVARRALP